MANKKGHRRFGSIRRLPSGRYQASYLTTSGQRRSAPETFERKGDADQWLIVVEGEMLRGEWIDPSLGKVLFGQYGAQWIEEHRLSARTREEYRSIWRHHVDPFLGSIELAELTTGVVRTWRSNLLGNGRSEDRTAKAYRLVRAIMNTAVDDGRVKRNPCRIKGAGEHRTAERPTATVRQVFDLADRMPGRFRALVLAAAFTSLRWGELVGLRRCDVDLSTGTVHVRRRLAQLSRGGLQAGPPKSAAGVRNVVVPPFLVEVLRDHLAEYSGSGPEGLIFCGQKGAMLRRGNFGRATDWPATVVKAGLPAGFHFHDLRHTGNQLAANSGATTRELMHRMGHGSMRAALIYQHATTDRDRRIAEQMAAMVERERHPQGDQNPDDEGGALGA
ncbi:tyrosine-type recombinase/integrase [Pseudonocardia sp. SID8383]|uniref:tyrosine-type recombinase/integrase n=1 Tax=Pseudonocardia sp. SID8383 TaxID=2690363 RepID=UPI00136F903A|nr:site-specific integrase [Pseudonocardia sp. SID8383]MYW74193.1 tyrosine-type recombinase/integrase [Pseudonocardia sp. SID8383]